MHKTKDLDDGYMGSGKLISRAIKKYGVDNFAKEILHVFDQEWKMKLAEKILVVTDPKISYNLCPGGHGGFGYINKNKELRIEKNKKARIEANKKIKEIYGVDNFAKTEIFKKKNSERMKNLWQKGHLTKKPPSFLGKKHRQESKLLMSISKKGKNTGNKNSQYGTMWINNGIENKKIPKDIDPIPEGWAKGRKIKFS